MVFKVKSKLVQAWSSYMNDAGGGCGRRRKTKAATAPILSGIELAVAQCTGAHGREEEDKDDKYVQQILFLVSNSPASVTFLSRQIADRVATTRDPTVALRALVLLHRLLRGGDRRFEEGMGESWSSRAVEMDLSWCSAAAGDPSSSFLIRYSMFLRERLGWIINHAGMLEPIEPPPQSPNHESAIRRLERCQTFLDRAMGCLPPNDGDWGSATLMRSAFGIVLRESFRVYENFSDGVTTVLRSFSELEGCLKKPALSALREARIQTPKLGEFYDECRRRDLGRSTSDYPSVRVVTEDDLASAVQGDTQTRIISRHVNEIHGRDASRSLFSRRLETKISEVWVGFDEED